MLHQIDKSTHSARHDSQTFGERLNADDSITLVAPFGLAALFDDTITFNAKNGDRAAYAQRVLDKGWLQRWPRLRQVKI